MKETKQGLASPEARAAMHELMGAFEAFKAANDERLEAIERKAGDGLLEEKVARIDQAVGAAQDRLERLSAEARRPVVGSDGSSPLRPLRGLPSPEGEGDAGFKSYMRTGQTAGLIEVKTGLAAGSGGGGYVASEQVERMIERRPRWLDEGDLAISWIRRSSEGGDGWDMEPSLGAAQDLYDVRILDDEATVVTREVVEATFLWSALEQEAAFPGGLPTGLVVQVRQGSEVFGWGEAAQITL